ncbi:50S ribosomal protein L23 [bacterium]|nr:50S ribosomal protein L23 [bacterium]
MAHSKQGKYTLEVRQSVNKIEIKSAVKSLFGVDVKSVNIIKTKPKKRRRGRIVGETSWMKKAIITLKDDQVIDSIMKIYS